MQTKKKSSSPIKTFYLIAYNFLSAIGWSYVLFLTVKTALSWKSNEELYESKNLYNNTRYFLKLLLASAGLEVFHAAFRLVPSNPVVVFPQVFIRFLVIWAVADKFDSSTKSSAIFLLNMAWSISEVTRYFYYVFNLIGNEPYFIKWSRYNLFIVLYPIGAFAETMVIALAAWYVQPVNVRNKYSLLLPNKFNISFDLFYCFWLWILLYIPVFPFMYFHMLNQRKKYLYASNNNNAAKKLN